MACSPSQKTIWLYRHGSARNDNPDIDAGLDADGQIETVKAAQYILKNSSGGNVVVLCSHLNRGKEAARIMKGLFEHDHRPTAAAALTHILSNEQDVWVELLNIICAMDSIPFSASEIFGKECQNIVVIGHRRNLLLESLRIQLNPSDEILRLTGTKFEAFDPDSLATIQELDSVFARREIDMFEESRLVGFQIGNRWENCLNNGQCIADVSFSSKDDRPHLMPDGNIVYRNMVRPF